MVQTGELGGPCSVLHVRTAGGQGGRRRVREKTVICYACLTSSSDDSCISRYILLPHPPGDQGGNEVKGEKEEGKQGEGRQGGGLRLVFTECLCHKHLLLKSSN